MEQQLIVHEEPRPATLWSKGLGSLLLQEDDGSGSRAGAIRLISINPVLRRECEALLPVLESAKDPASAEEIMALVAMNMPSWGVPKKSAEEWGLTYMSYAKALEGMPLHAVRGGIVRWNRGEGHKDLSMGGFPPRPAQLVLLASEARRELFMAAYRAKLAMEYVEEKLPAPISEEERARNAAAIREMMAKPQGRLPPQPPGMTAAEWGRQCREKGLVETGPPPAHPAAPRRSPQEVAASLLAAAAGQARQSGAPVSRKHFEDPGDVV